LPYVPPKTGSVVLDIQVLATLPTSKGRDRIPYDSAVGENFGAHIQGLWRELDSLLGDRKDCPPGEVKTDPPRQERRRWT